MDSSPLGRPHSAASFPLAAIRSGRCFWGRFSRSKGAVAGLVFASLLILASVVSHAVLDFDADITAMSIDILSPPSASHPFGTDHLGRDVLKRVLYGSAYSLSIGIASSAIGMIIGSVLGSVAGYVQGAADAVVMRVNEMFYSIPNILIATVTVSLFGASFINLALSLSVSSAISFTRTVRTQTMRIKSLPFIDSARVIGQNPLEIIFKHVLPNCAPHILTQFSMSIAVAILSVSSLSFLGIGVPLPYPEWGGMLSDSRGYMRSGFWSSFFPGAFLALSVLSFNLIADGLADAFDSKALRRKAMFSKGSVLAADSAPGGNRGE